MADIKISQLTAKGSAIANTDLLEISQSDGAGGYVTKSVTGANIIGSKQDTLISGTNIKTINSNSILGSGNLVIGGVSSVSATTPVVATGTTTPVISLASNYGDTLNPYASKTANNILAAPNGTAGVPTFRAIVSADIPTLNQNTTGTADNVTGIVAVANGGTGTATPSLVAGTNVTITGTFPNQTINSSGGGGGGLQGINALFNLQSGDTISNNLGGFGSFTSSALVNNRIALTPFLPNQNITTSNLQIEVNATQAGSNCIILIYSNSNGLPDTKIFESAALDCSTVGTKTATTTQTFTAGTTYWIGIHGQNTAILWAIQQSQSLPIKIIGNTNGGLVANYVFKDVTFGSAPASFGTPTGFGNIAPYLVKLTKA